VLSVVVREGYLGHYDNRSIRVISVASVIRVIRII
jgi:hypothetical protein